MDKVIRVIPIPASAQTLKATMTIPSLIGPQVPRGRGFVAKVGVEALPARFTWAPRDWVALLAVPAIFATDWIAEQLSTDVSVRGITDTIVRVLLFGVLVVANRGLLGRHWRAFWSAPWRSIGVVVGGMIAIQIVVTALGAALRPLVGGTHDSGGGDSHLAFAVLLVVSFNPVATALIEDFTFRHTLLMKLLVRHRFWYVALLTVANAILFGALHVNNFDGHWLLTLSFAGAGLVMNLTYLWTRNIWHVLLMHGLNNFILGGPLTVVFVQILSAAVG